MKIMIGFTFIFLMVLMIGCKDKITQLSDGCEEKIAEPPPISIIINENIDLNGDGSIDYVFEYLTLCTTDYPTSVCNHSLIIRPQSENEVQYKAYQGTQPLEDGIVIDSTIGWSVYGGSLAYIKWSLRTGWDSCWSGTFVGVGQKNLGLRLKINGQYHYGWIKISITSDSGKYTIHDCVYQIKPNLPIIAGVKP